MAKSTKLQLEFNSEFHKAKTDFNVANVTVIVTPPVGEDYWMFRVKLSKTQSIIGFPKFGTIGIGFAKETDWNTNLPYSCETNEIFEHIKHNKGSKTITDSDCIEAIKLVQKAAVAFKGK